MIGHALRPRIGMTLAECLVVIAVLGILAYLILSAISIVKYKADLTACASNLRQVGVAALLFAADNGERFPADGNKGVSDSAQSPAWFYRLPAYVCR